MTTKSFISTLFAIPHYPNEELSPHPDLDVLTDIVSSVSQKSVSTEDGDTSTSTKSEVKDLRDMITAALYNKKLQIDSELRQKVTFNTFRTQLVFTLIIFISLTTAVLFIYSPSDLFPKWYMFAATLMLLSRVVDYTQKKEHFFLIDFCYTAGVQILFFLMWRPQSIHLATRTFGFGAGVLGWSTVLFTNGLTAHRLDEFCSLWIHTVPSFLAYTLRWTNENSVLYYKTTNFEFSTDHVVQYYIACYAPYALWATGYYIIITKAFRHLTIEGDYMTLIRYLAEKSTFFERLLDIFGAKHRSETFILYHATFFTITTLIGYVCFFHRTLHTVCISLIILSMIVHGGKILAQDIAEPYEKRLKKINSLLSTLG